MKNYQQEDPLLPNREIWSKTWNSKTTCGSVGGKNSCHLRRCVSLNKTYVPLNVGHSPGLSRKRGKSNRCHTPVAKQKNNGFRGGLSNSACLLKQNRQSKSARDIVYFSDIGTRSSVHFWRIFMVVCTYVFTLNACCLLLTSLLPAFWAGTNPRRHW